MSTAAAVALTALPARVLLIEDDPEQKLLVQYTLDEFGPGRYQLEWASQLSEGLRRLSENQADSETRHHTSENPFDVILLDLGFPESSGPGSFLAVRQAAPNIPVVVLTADHREQTVRAVIDSGAAGYLVKQEASGLHLIRALSGAISGRKVQAETTRSEPVKFRAGAWRWQAPTIPAAPVNHTEKAARNAPPVRVSPRWPQRLSNPPAPPRVPDRAPAQTNARDRRPVLPEVFPENADVSVDPTSLVQLPLQQQRDQKRPQKRQNIHHQVIAEVQKPLRRLGIRMRQLSRHIVGPSVDEDINEDVNENLDE